MQEQRRWAEINNIDSNLIYVYRVPWQIYLLSVNTVFRL